VKVLRLSRFIVMGLLSLALFGCSQATPTPLPTLVLGTPAPVHESSAGSVTASGELVPVRQIELGFAAAGVVAEVKVKEGDTVKAGQIIASLGNTDRLETIFKASQQVLASAQKDLDDLNTGAALNLADAEQAMVAAQKQYDDAQKHRKIKDYHRCEQDTIDLYGQILDDKKDALKRLQDNMEARDTTYLRKLTAAQSEVDVAQSNYLYCISFTAQEIAESDAAIAVGDASLKQATARYELLKQTNGIDPSELLRRTAAVANAQAAQANAQTALEQAALLSPVDGTVVSLDVKAGQAVQPGQSLVSLASLDQFQAETTDLSEKDIARVKVGQTALVSIEALGTDVQGKVVRITPRATKVGGDVVFKVVVQLDQQPAGLLWGMSAKVEIKPN
jgi:multidrug efflux pump subunit AcrA (membrane-fusion protein)